MICGKPAVYFGNLNQTVNNSYQGSPYLTMVEKPFCKECVFTRPSGGWLRQFVSFRLARPDETCMASVEPGVLV